MSFFSTAKKVIDIVDWITCKYDGLTSWIKKKWKIRQARSIRSDVDEQRVDKLRKRIEKIIKKRQDRSDGA